MEVYRDSNTFFMKKLKKTQSRKSLDQTKFFINLNWLLFFGLFDVTHSMLLSSLCWSTICLYNICKCYVILSIIMMKVQLFTKLKWRKFEGILNDAMALPNINNGNPSRHNDNLCSHQIAAPWCNPILYSVAF